jgi:hypothetical protein
VTYNRLNHTHVHSHFPMLPPRAHGWSVLYHAMELLHQAVVRTSADTMLCLAVPSLGIAVSPCRSSAYKHPLRICPGMMIRRNMLPLGVDVHFTSQDETYLQQTVDATFELLRDTFGAAVAVRWARSAWCRVAGR